MTPLGTEKPRILIVGPPEPVSESLHATAEACESRPDCPFSVISAKEGQEAVLRAEQAESEGKGIVAAVIDTTLNGTRYSAMLTLRRLWQLAPELDVVLVSRDTQRTLSLVEETFESLDRILILPAPLSVDGLWALVPCLTARRRSVQQRETRIRNLRAWAVDAEGGLRNLQELHEALERAHSQTQQWACELAEMLKQRTVETAETRDVTVLALARLAESRDPETGAHIERMRTYAQTLADHLSSQGRYVDQIDRVFLEDIYRSSPLHDIGKVGIPDEILLKPARLTPEEFEIMKRHTIIGADALGQVASRSDFTGFLEMAGQIARHHHERWDGTGYPDGLAGTDIPLAARIVALADVFDALTSIRVYKEAIEPNMTRRLIVEQAGKHFDPVVVEALEACFDRFQRILEITRSGGVAALEILAPTR